MEYHTDEVFGITRDVPLNYVFRPAVDQVLLDSLQQNRHIVIHGSSKQGKTCLRKYHLGESGYVFVQCNHTWDLTQLHGAILKAAGYRIEQSAKRTLGGKFKINASMGAKFLGVGGAMSGEGEGSIHHETQVKPLEIDLEDVNDIISALKESRCSRLIVLEDFHYLPKETQMSFSFALKAFHESSNYQFIIVGVWREENRLIVFNGDLTGRVVSVNADRWKPEELLQVVDSGSEKLNIEFAKTFKDDLISHCMESVYIVQEVCRLACKRAGIESTQPHRQLVGKDLDVGQMTREVVYQQRARYAAFITNFAEGFQQTELEMYKWLLYPVLTAEISDLETGLKFTYLKKVIQEKHPSGSSLNVGNLTQALQYSASLQIKKNIKPIILDYDSTNRILNVVDRGFLIWLANQNRQDILSDAGLA